MLSLVLLRYKIADFQYFVFDSLIYRSLSYTQTFSLSVSVSVSLSSFSFSLHTLYSPPFYLFKFFNRYFLYHFFFTSVNIYSHSLFSFTISNLVLTISRTIFFFYLWRSQFRFFFLFCFLDYQFFVFVFVIVLFLFLLFVASVINLFLLWCFYSPNPFLTASSILTSSISPFSSCNI